MIVIRFGNLVIVLFEALLLAAKVCLPAPQERQNFLKNSTTANFFCI